MARRPPNVFSLSFLDIMFCGFGAVVLLYMIIHHDSVVRREATMEDLMAETDRLAQAVAQETRLLAELKNTRREQEQEVVETTGRSERVIREIATRRRELDRMKAETLARKEHIDALKADLKSTEEQRRRLKAAAEEQAAEGRRLRSFAGQGDRQYLTGLRVGGERILFLVDTSASMLADTVVNVIVRRNLPDSVKRRSEKWLQAVRTVDWLTTQIPPASQYQIYAFNEKAYPVIAGTDHTWLDASKVKRLNQALIQLASRVPGGGTNLYRAFEVISAMRPKPDNVILITDSLPTQGQIRTTGSTVDGKERVALFEKAVRVLPRGIPVNIVLFPMEGDPMAAPAFWKLATHTRGALISPAEDWP